MGLFDLSSEPMLLLPNEVSVWNSVVCADSIPSMCAMRLAQCMLPPSLAPIEADREPPTQLVPRPAPRQRLDALTKHVQPRTWTTS